MLFGSAGMMIVLLTLLVIGGIIAVAVAATRQAIPGLGHEPAGTARSSRDIVSQDIRSIIRPAYLFVALGTCVLLTLSAAWQMLFYALSRALGIDQPGGERGSLGTILAGPASTLLVFGMGWLYQRHALAAQASAQAELPYQAGVRRLYTYLVALISLATLAAGVGYILWTLADLVTTARSEVTSGDWWRENLALGISLALIGLPVWAAHWLPVAAAARRDPDEAQSLSRRLYVYLTLLAGVVALLGAGAVAAKQLLDLALGATATASAITNLARAVSVAAVAGITVFYHQRILRADAAVHAAAATSPPATAAHGETVAAQPGAAPVADQVTVADGAALADLANLAVLAQAAGGALSPAIDRPYGVIRHRGRAESSAWFTTEAAAQAAYDATTQRVPEGPSGHPPGQLSEHPVSRLAGSSGDEWVALIQLHDTHQPANFERSGSGAESNSG